jgi:hypothetical protein
MGKWWWLNAPIWQHSMSQRAFSASVFSVLFSITVYEWREKILMTHNWKICIIYNVARKHFFLYTSPTCPKRLPHYPKVWFQKSRNSFQSKVDGTKHRCSNIIRFAFTVIKTHTVITLAVTMLSLVSDECANQQTFYPDRYSRNAANHLPLHPENQNLNLHKV